MYGEQNSCATAAVCLVCFCKLLRIQYLVLMDFEMKNIKVVVLKR
jgi:hypothetical protein